MPDAFTWRGAARADELNLTLQERLEAVVLEAEEAFRQTGPAPPVGPPQPVQVTHTLAPTGHRAQLYPELPRLKRRVDRLDWIDRALAHLLNSGVLSLPK